MFNIIFFFINLWAAVYSGKGGKPNHGKLEGYGHGQDKGICLSPDKILLYCMAGTKIGEKMQAAIEKCSKECGKEDNDAKPGKGKESGKGKGKGKGKGSKGKGNGGKGKGKGKGKNSGAVPFECSKIDEIKEQFKEAHKSNNISNSFNLLSTCLIFRTIMYFPRNGMAWS